MTIDTVTGSTASASLSPGAARAAGAPPRRGARARPQAGRLSCDYAARAVSRTAWPCSEWRTSSLATGVSRRSGRHSSHTRLLRPRRTGGRARRSAASARSRRSGGGPPPGRRRSGAAACARTALHGCAGGVMLARISPPGARPPAECAQKAEIIILVGFVIQNCDRRPGSALL